MEQFRKSSKNKKVTKNTDRNTFSTIFDFFFDNPTTSMIDIEIETIGKYDSYQNNVNFYEEIINLTNNSEKISPSGGPPSGRLLKRRAVSDGPLSGDHITTGKHVFLQEKCCRFRRVQSHFTFSPPLKNKKV